MALAEQIPPAVAGKKSSWPIPLKSAKVELHKLVVTPQMAAEALEIESPDRLLSEGTADAYARLMAEARWKFNGEAIQFANTGRRLNGLHRLTACVKAQMPFETVVVTGLPEEVQSTMDDPRRRTVNDQQRIQGMELPSSASAAARVLLRLRLGRKGNRRTTNQEVLDVLVKHTGLGESAAKIAKVDTVALPPSVAVAMHYIGSKLLGKPDKANAFLEVLLTGLPAYDGDPAHLWREKLIKAKAHGRGLPATEAWAGTVHAWNLFAANEPAKRFMIPEDVEINGLDIRKI